MVNRRRRSVSSSKTPRRITRSSPDDGGREEQSAGSSVTQQKAVPVTRQQQDADPAVRQRPLRACRAGQSKKRENSDIIGVISSSSFDLNSTLEDEDNGLGIEMKLPRTAKRQKAVSYTHLTLPTILLV